MGEEGGQPLDVAAIAQAAYETFVPPRLSDRHPRWDELTVGARVTLAEFVRCGARALETRVRRELAAERATIQGVIHDKREPPSVVALAWLRGTLIGLGVVESILTDALPEEEETT